MQAECQVPAGTVRSSSSEIESYLAQTKDRLDSLLVEPTGLPCRIVTADGTTLVARPMKASDIGPFYTNLISSPGYGVDELPTIEFFVDNYVSGWINVIYELADTGETVAFSNLHGPTPYSRSATASAIFDGGNFIFVEKYRGRKWFSELSRRMYEQVAGDRLRGVVGYQGDSAVTSLSAVFGVATIGYLVNGVLPRGICLARRGWVDLLLYFKLVSNDNRFH